MNNELNPKCCLLEMKRKGTEKERRVHPLNKLISTDSRFSRGSEDIHLMFQRKQPFGHALDRSVEIWQSAGQYCLGSSFQLSYTEL